MTIEEFADANNLMMVINERKLPRGNPSRYCAKFRDCEVMLGGMLVGKCGYGATPEEAIKNYAPEISLQRIAIDALSKNRREIEVPRLA